MTNVPTQDAELDAYYFMAAAVLEGIIAAGGNASTIQVQLVIGRSAACLKRREIAIRLRAIKEVRDRVRDAWSD
jgi:hypothetical protein